jgi:hypothetical protein
VRNYLECGDLREGSESRYARLPARIKCPDCHHEYIPAYSCRGRWFPESRSSLTSRVAIVNSKKVESISSSSYF